MNSEDEGYVGDRIVGGVSIAISIIGIFVGLGLLASMSRPEIRAAPSGGVFPAVLGCFGCLAVLNLILEWGIFCSRRWAFIVTVILSAIALVSIIAAPRAGHNLLQTLHSIFMLFYCSLRLGRAFGPELK